MPSPKSVDKFPDPPSPSPSPPEQPPPLQYEPMEIPNLEDIPSPDNDPFSGSWGQQIKA